MSAGRAGSARSGWGCTPAAAPPPRCAPAPPSTRCRPRVACHLHDTSGVDFPPPRRELFAFPLRHESKRDALRGTAETLSRRSALLLQAAPGARRSGCRRRRFDEPMMPAADNGFRCRRRLLPWRCQLLLAGNSTRTAFPSRIPSTLPPWSPSRSSRRSTRSSGPPPRCWAIANVDTLTPPVEPHDLEPSPAPGDRLAVDADLVVYLKGFSPRSTPPSNSRARRTSWT